MSESIIKEMKELIVSIGKDKISEKGKVVDINKLNLSEYSSTVREIIDILKKNGIKAKIDTDNLTGEMDILGFRGTKFSIGDENFYFELPKNSVKEGFEQVIKALIAFGKVINNYL